MSAVLPERFDVVACPLTGTNLIEASAGTGKTYNLCFLYLRLLIESERDVREILVVTFTRAATGELRERIRARMTDLLARIETGEVAEDPLIERLFQKFMGLFSADILAARLRFALQSFDEASIFTVHGFCQRALSESAFSAGWAERFEVVDDAREILLSVARDFWRRAVATLAPGVLPRWLVEQGIAPETLVERWQCHRSRTRAEVIWPEENSGDEAGLQVTLAEAFAHASACWAREAQAVVDYLAQGHLSKVSYKDAAIAAALTEWQRVLDGGHPFAPFGEKLLLLVGEKIGKAVTKKGQPPDCNFFDAVQAFLDARMQLDTFAQNAYLQLLRRFLSEAEQTLAERARIERIQSQDDLLKNLYDALQADGSGRFHEALRRAYPVALIDEFQDTDPLQYAIFETLYRGQNGPVFFVGDPKQAIYAFRNADLATYLVARKQTDARYTLSENQRSSGELISACNRLFEANLRVFMQDGLDYVPVACGARLRKDFRDVGSDARALTVWLFDQNGDDDSNAGDDDESFTAQAIRATVAEIARLLNDALVGAVTIAGQPLAPGDIAVLVRSHTQGRQMRRALAETGIASVELSQDSVFQSEAAPTLAGVLAALLNPARAALLRGALALLGADSAQLLVLIDDERALETVCERFARYRTHWRRHGIAAALRELTREEDLAGRWLAQIEGERRLTDWLHLIELVHRAADDEGIDDEALLHWLQARIEAHNGGEAAQLRLESDEARVQIVTVHKSKGLEYPVVFCPFLCGTFKRESAGRQAGVEYQPEFGARVIDYRLFGVDSRQWPEDIAEAKHLEQAGEALRLIYVAITRAVYRCYLAVTPVTKKGGVQRSLLNWMAAGSGMAPADWFGCKLSGEDVRRAWQKLDCAQLAVIAPPVVSVARTVPESPEAPLRALPPPAHIDPGWRIGSFSGLTRGAQLPEAIDEPGAENDGADVAVRENDILDFPRGAQAGVCLHALFEHIDFTQPETWDARIEATLAAYPLPEAAHEQLAPLVRTMLDDVLETELIPGLRLAGIASEKRLNEIEFLLPASLATPPLERLLKDAGYGEARLPYATLEGYLKGVIDLVFEHQGRYYLLDWKSNHLGTQVEDYRPDALRAAMRAHHYHLQALFYGVALVRFLRRRLADFEIARDFGGVLYLFVRGVRPNWRNPDGSPAGVVFERLPAALIARCEDLLAGETS